MEQLENEKHELESQNQEFRNGTSTTGAATVGKTQDRIPQLEQELNQLRDQLVQSQREVQKLQSQIRVSGNKDVAPTGPVLSKSRSLEVSIETTIKILAIVHLDKPILSLGHEWRIEQIKRRYFPNSTRSSRFT